MCQLLRVFSFIIVLRSVCSLLAFLSSACPHKAYIPAEETGKGDAKIIAVSYGMDEGH